MLFVDFLKAFDSVNRNKITNIHKAYVIPTEIIKATTMLYTNKTAIVSSPDYDSDSFDICAGVLQGDTAYFFFVLIMNYKLVRIIDPTR